MCRNNKDGRTAACTECINAYKRERYRNKADEKAYYVAKAKRVELARKAVDPGWRRMWNAWRTAKELHRVPGWVCTADVLPVYREAAAMGEAFVVDHIIPLKGEYVSGLHVPGNLQILTKETNGRKSNHYPYHLFLEL